MCFSPTVSFTAGAVLGLIGTATVVNVRRKQDLPFAVIPLLFAIQQIIEGISWLSLNAGVTPRASTFAFLLFSHVLWPTYIPLTVFLMERNRWRRNLLGVFIAVGAIVSAYFLYYLLTEQVTAKIVNQCIAYVSPHFLVTFVLSPYSVATCASCLFSSRRIINLFGVATFLSALVAYRFYDHAFVSVWCFFAAILSMIIFLHFYAERESHNES